MRQPEHLFGKRLGLRDHRFDLVVQHAPVGVGVGEFQGQRLHRSVGLFELARRVGERVLQRLGLALRGGQPRDRRVALGLDAAEPLLQLRARLFIRAGFRLQFFDEAAARLGQRGEAVLLVLSVHQQSGRALQIHLESLHLDRQRVALQRQRLDLFPEV